MTTLEILRDHRLVYLATPYSKYPAGIEAAFDQAARLNGLLVAVGVASYSPIAHTHPCAIKAGLDPYDHAIWLPYDAAMMALADILCVVKMDGWDRSVGIAHEIEAFKAAGKPVVLLDPKEIEAMDRVR